METNQIHLCCLTYFGQQVFICSVLLNKGNHKASPCLFKVCANIPLIDRTWCFCIHKLFVVIKRDGRLNGLGISVAISFADIDWKHLKLYLVCLCAKVVLRVWAAHCELRHQKLPTDYLVCVQFSSLSLWSSCDKNPIELLLPNLQSYELCLKSFKNTTHAIHRLP